MHCKILLKNASPLASVACFDEILLEESSDRVLVEQTQDYYPYGSAMRQYTSSVSTENVSKFKYQGKERDIESGYDYVEARIYDSQLGRFLQIDPLAEKMRSWAPYMYGFDNPILNIDFNGLIPLSSAVKNNGISSGFGIRIHPIRMKLMGHGGVDLKTSGTGHSVHALADGIVKKIGWNLKFDEKGNKTGYGRYIIVEHKGGYQSLYAHLEKDGALVKVGQAVKNGEEIGNSGNTGGSTGPHLHVEISQGDIMKKENKIDPESIDDLQTKIYGEENKPNEKEASNLFTSSEQDNTKVSYFYQGKELKVNDPKNFRIK